MNPRVIIIVSFLLFAIGGHAEEKECEKWLAPALHDEVFLPIDEYTLALQGRFDDMTASGYLGHVEFDMDLHPHAVVTINNVQVLAAYRGRGVQTRLFSKLLNDLEAAHGKLQLKVYNMAETNGEIFFEGFIRRLNARFPDLRIPKLKGKDREPWTNAFEECCRTFTRDNPEKIMDLLWDAFRETPAYKTRMKLGYDRICPGVPVTLDFSGSIRVHLCK